MTSTYTDVLKRLEDHKFFVQDIRNGMNLSSINDKDLKAMYSSLASRDGTPNFIFQGPFQGYGFTIRVCSTSIGHSYAGMLIKMYTDDPTDIKPVYTLFSSEHKVQLMIVPPIHQPPRMFRNAVEWYHHFDGMRKGPFPKLQLSPQVGFEYRDRFALLQAPNSNMRCLHWQASASSRKEFHELVRKIPNDYMEIVIHLGSTNEKNLMDCIRMDLPVLAMHDLLSTFKHVLNSNIMTYCTSGIGENSSKYTGKGSFSILDIGCEAMTDISPALFAALSEWIQLPTRVVGLDMHRGNVHVKLATQNNRLEVDVRGSNAFRVEEYECLNGLGKPFRFVNAGFNDHQINLLLNMVKFTQPWSFGGSCTLYTHRRTDFNANHALMLLDCPSFVCKASVADWVYERSDPHVRQERLVQAQLEDDDDIIVGSGFVLDITDPLEGKRVNPLDVFQDLLNHRRTMSVLIRGQKKTGLNTDLLSKLKTFLY